MPQGSKYQLAATFTSFGCAAWLISCPSLAFASGLSKQVSTKFNIQAMQADEALIAFARQASLTIIFPYEAVRKIEANALVGNYTNKEALALLLKETGLEAEFNNKGSVSISLIHRNQDKPLLSQLAALLTSEGEKLQITPEPDTPNIEYIEVRGIRASVQRALDVKYHHFGIVDTIQAEEIGKFPDLNLAESLQRITGVSIDRSEGEGQFVTVRGFGPEFNTVLINGRKLPSDNLGREFSFDTLPSELVSGVDVQKTNQAHHLTGGIGAAINIKTARPMHARGFKIAGHVNALYDTNSNATRPQGAMLISHSNNKFGWLISASHQAREARIEEAEIDGWLLNTDVPASQLNNNAVNLFVPRNFDQRVRFDKRTRTGGTLVLQYRPNVDVDLSLDYLTSSFAVETDSTSMGHWFTSSNLENVHTDENGTAIDFSQRVGHATDFHARTFNRPSKLRSIGVNMQWQASNKLALEGDIGFAKAGIDDTQGAADALTLLGFLNRSSFLHNSGDTLPQIFGFESANVGNFDAISEENYLNPANGRAHVMLRRGWEIDDEIVQVRFDGVFSNYDAPLPLDLRFGVTYTVQQKQNNRWDNESNAVHCTYCGYFDTPDIPDSFQTRFDAGNDFLSSISGSSTLPNMWLRHNGNDLINYLESLGEVDFSPVLRDSSFAVKETAIGAYSSARFNHQLGNTTIDTEIGLRYESTQVEVSGFDAQLVRLEILDQTELSPVTAPASPLTQSKTDTQWLPSLLSQWQLTDQFVLRLGVSKTVTRPTLTQLSPSAVFNTTRQGGDLRASQGNPDLLPFRSTNYDVSFEWYANPNRFASIAYFKKSVDNFIVSNVGTTTFNDVTDPSTGSDPQAADNNDDIAVFDLTQPINGETAVVEGLELAYQQHFDNGFGFLANMTMIDSNAELDRDNIAQKFALTGLSDTQNLILFYDNQDFQFRIAWNRRSDFLQSLTQSQSGEPTFVEAYDQVDLSASYQLNAHFSLFIEGINVTEASVLKHGRYPNHFLLAQSPGARYSLGLRGSF